jgi:hypothetical protein
MIAKTRHLSKFKKEGMRELFFQLLRQAFEGDTP